MIGTKKYYYVDMVYKTGMTARVWLSEGTWAVWGGRIACNKDNPFAKGSVLVGLDQTMNPICVRTRDLSTMQLGEYLQPNNPLNCEDHYDNPLS